MSINLLSALKINGFKASHLHVPALSLDITTASGYR